MATYDLYFDGRHPVLVLAREQSGKPAQYVDLDPAKLRRLWPLESMTYVYDGLVSFPSGFFSMPLAAQAAKAAAYAQLGKSAGG
ncbi:MAG TPA: hypothetical protein VKS43_01555 [Burkholderiales bacterium]|nr:hypothetical protein [Burkholderiales bacterium]